ncbi:MAG TPA: FAD/NAD(P)-binding protein [Mycobacteriales bacterium]|nr:FAD/NAD(P)-binding protein [Mycobacteriales bacterium]
MTALSRSDRSSFAIVGAGAAGTLTAARLLDESSRRGRAIEISLIDPRPSTGRGVAYSTVDDRHLLNVPAEKMSAYPEDGNHFLRWLEADAEGGVEPCDFVPRRRFGRYLDDVLATALSRNSWARLHRVQDSVVDLVELVDLVDGASGCRLILAGGDTLDVDAVVLAIGHLGPELSWVPEGLRESPAFVADPWSPSSFVGIPDDGDVLLVGTGLTMVDTVSSLERPGRTVHAVSRRGELPRAHVAGRLPDMEAPEFSSPTPTLAELRTVVARHVAKSKARYGDWRPAIDSVRSMFQQLWRNLSDSDREEFVAVDGRSWDTARHRIPPRSAEVIRQARDDGRLVTHTGSVETVSERGSRLEVTLSDGSVLTVAAVVNCTGPCHSPHRSTDPLVRALADRGVAVTGPLGLGVDTGDDGRLRDATGRCQAPIWTLGSLRRGSLWETTAIREIRSQAVALAECLLGPALEPDRRPTDPYGLPLSTTDEAATQWCTALDAVRRLQGGAEQALESAVEADPGFAMGHAALALVGYEWGVELDVTAALTRAIDAAAIRADPRERSFVQTVVRRVTGAREAGDAALLRHVTEHPRDALALTVAIPTIAFGGLAQPVEESWALMDSLAPAYGDDWWFAGLHAFVCQEQGRYADAQRLATRSLTEQPAAGHAAHALTHVYYETGDHVGGLSWLDGWITEHGPLATYRAHYAWHAALHELSLDDAAAVRRRYAEQLAPPAVSGARALVDSASLLWRSWLVGAWEGQLPVDAILSDVPSCLLEHPSTAFGALHAAVAMAAGGHIEGLERLRRYAATRAEPVFPEEVVPLCTGLAALVEGDADRAIPALAVAVQGAHRLGGSAAQQEVVLETLVHALVLAGRTTAACGLISERLDRRPSPVDRRRLTQLSGPMLAGNG